MLRTKRFNKCKVLGRKVGLVGIPECNYHLIYLLIYLFLFFIFLLFLFSFFLFGGGGEGRNYGADRLCQQHPPLPQWPLL